MLKIKLAPSILSSDWSNVNEEIKQVEKCSQLIHVDIMDGKFVKQKTWNSEFIRRIKTKVPLDVHMMVSEPENEYIKSFIDAGASSITVHYEACSDLKKTLLFIKKNKIKCCIALKPKTPLSKIKKYLDIVDMVLIMTVEPGKAGQEFMPEPLEKIKELRKLKPELDIEVDGGVHAETIKSCYDAGANVFVAGSSVFGERDRVEAIKKLMGKIKITSN